MERCLLNWMSFNRDLRSGITRCPSQCHRILLSNLHFENAQWKKKVHYITIKPILRQKDRFYFKTRNDYLKLLINETNVTEYQYK